MKILGISGGHKNGADCMCKEALLAAKEQGAEIEFVRLMDLDIKLQKISNMRHGKARTVSVHIAIPETSTLRGIMWQSAVSAVSVAN